LLMLPLGWLRVGSTLGVVGPLVVVLEVVGAENVSYWALVAVASIKGAASSSSSSCPLLA